MLQWWKKVNFFRGSKKSTCSESVSEDQLTDHYKKILSGTNPEQEEEEHHLDTEKDPKNSVQNEELDEEFTKQELRDTMIKLKNGKAAGEDGITTEFIKTFPDSRQNELLQAINSIWTRCELPFGWNTAIIYSVYKTGDPSEPANYRGISLLDAGYKILTGMMANRLHLYTNNK